MAQVKFLDCRDSETQKDSLAELHKYEAAAIEIRRWKAGLRDSEPSPDLERAAPPRDLVGLALSGGGARSASFNLGFLQALSQSGRVRYVGYMSSVSGGGYIAGHVTALASLKPSGGEGFHGSPEARLGLAKGEQLDN